MIVRELITKLGFNLDKGQLNSAQRGVDNLKNSADRAAGAFRNLATALSGVLSVRAIINIGDEMQSLRARIGQLPQTIGDAAESFDVIAARASNAKQSIDAYGTFYVKAGNATQDYIKDQETLLKVVDGAAFGLAASGATAVAQKQAFFQLGQAIGSPVIQMEEMNTLIDVAPDLFRELGKVIPGADGNLKKFVSTGKVTGRMLAEGLTKAAVTFEKKMKEIPLTVGQATTLVGNKFSLMIDKMNRESRFITRIADFMLQAMESIEEGVNGMIKKFDGWENAMRFVGIAIGVALGAKTIAILRTFELASLRAMGVWILWAAAIAAVALVIEDIYVWAQGGESITGRLIGPWEEWRDKVMSVIDGLKEVLSGLKDIVMGIFTFDLYRITGGIIEVGKVILSLIADLGKKAGQLLLDSLLGALTSVWGGITGMWGNLQSRADASQKYSMERNQGVSVGQMAPSAMGAGRPNVTSNTNVNVTVPQGTSDAQVKFLQTAAQKSFAGAADNNLARSMSTYAP